MNVAATEVRQWMVSARSRGEVLTTSVRGPGVELVLLGAPASYDPDELEGWLRDLIAVSRETAAGDTGTRPIPALLHHLLTGLLFSHAEIWSRSNQPAPLSLAFVRTDRLVAFGWVGDPTPELWLDDQPTTVEWVRIRDQSGNEARSLAVDLRHRVRLHMPVSFAFGTQPLLASVDAAWVPDQAPSAATPLQQSKVVVRSQPAHATPRTQAAHAAPHTQPAHAAPRTQPAPAAPPRIAPPAPPPDSDSPGVGAPAGALTEFDAPVEEAPHAEPPPASPPAAGWTVVYEGEAPEAGAEAAEVAPRPSRNWWQRISGWLTRRGRKGPAPSPIPASEPGTVSEWSEDQIASGALPEMIPPSPEPVELTSLTVEPLANEEPSAFVEYEPAPPLETASITPEAPPAPMGADEFRLEGLTPTEWMSPKAGPPPLRGTTASRSPGALGPRSRGPAPLPAEPRASAPHAPPTARVDAPARVTPVPMPASIAIPPRTEAQESAADPDPPEVGAPAAVPAPARRAPPARARVVAPVVPEDWAEPPVVPPRPVEDPSSPDASPPSRTRVRVPLRPHWPEAESARVPRPWWQQPWSWGGAVALLFLGGWLVGNIQGDREVGESNFFSRALHAMGLGGARFEVVVNSRPPGAWIAVDGKDLVKRSPATIEVSPGTHTVSLSFADLGSSAFTVKGARGDKVPLDAKLWGSLAVYSGDSAIPVAVTVDGSARGLAPVTIDSMMPGAHDVRFSGPGLQTWGQTAEVRVNETTQMVARPMSSPATGMIDVRASWTDAEGSVELNGANVYIDGERRGTTPLTLELPRGPHSVRIESRGEQSSVQVIDLPGGNQRFAKFELGLGADRPRLQVLGLPLRPSPEQTTVLSANLDGVTPGEVRDMWLHVRQPEGTWRRYEMTTMKSPGGVVGSAVFPITLLDDNGRTLFYVSSSTTTGDEYFSEILPALQAPPSKK